MALDPTGKKIIPGKPPSQNNPPIQAAKNGKKVIADVKKAKPTRYA